ncbi:MAG: MdtA/MuxA family multidrug efflux RND transporter periplasmic adaptor subunit [Burkholderiales bacterium]
MNRPADPFTSDPIVSAPKRTRWWLWSLIILIVAIGGYFAYLRFWPSPDPVSTAATKAGKGKKGDAFGGANRPIPIVALPARSGEIDIHLSGLGTITPLRTVTVKSRISGQLLRLHVAEGELVREGQLLAEIDPRPFEVQLAQAEGQMARDRALLDNARLDLDRYRTLFEQDSIAKQQVDTQVALVRQYEGAVKVDQSQIDNAKLQITYSRITAPITGRTGLRQLDQGNMVSGNEPNGLVVITQLQPISVVFSVPQDHLPAIMKRVRSGEKLTVEAWDREQKVRLATGSLASVDNLIDPATGTVKLKAQFANTDSSLFPNQFVNARLRLDTLKDATLISTAALQRGAQGTFVYVVKPDQTVTVRPITLGPAEVQQIAVTEGIKPGELVVIDGMDRLREGALVEVTTRPELKSSPDGRRPAGKEGRKKPPAGESAGAGPAAGQAAAASPGAPTDAAAKGEASKGRPEGGNRKRDGASADGEPDKGEGRRDRGPRKAPAE